MEDRRNEAIYMAKSAATSGETLLDCFGLLFQFAIGITCVQTLCEIAAEKGFDAAKPFVLGDVRKLVSKQLSIAPIVGPDENSIASG